MRSAVTNFNTTLDDFDRVVGAKTHVDMGDVRQNTDKMGRTLQSICRAERIVMEDTLGQPELGAHR